VQLADGPVEQGPDDRLGGWIHRELVSVALDHGGCVFVVHGATHRPQAICIGANSTAKMSARHAQHYDGKSSERVTNKRGDMTTLYDLEQAITEQHSTRMFLPGRCRGR
jgi:hypothetical protein